MSAPNIVGVATITAKTASINASSVNNLLVANAASSNKVFKVNTIFVANNDGNNSATVDVKFVNKDAITDAGAVSYDIAKQIEVPAGATVVLVDKNNAMYIEEDRSIYVSATEGTVSGFASYEEIS